MKRFLILNQAERKLFQLRHPGVPLDQMTDKHPAVIKFRSMKAFSMTFG